MGAMTTDVLVIGSGLAGMRFALAIAGKARVTVLTKRDREEGSSRFAQGGIAASWREGDSWQAHVQDTLIAGDGLCSREVVERTAKEAREAVQGLIDLGVEFDRWREHPDLYDLHREGGHSRRRILHAKDLTGAEIMRALFEQVDQHDNIEILENWMAVDLVTEGWLARQRGELPPRPDRVLGAYALHTPTDEVRLYLAKAVVICTGGSGKVYLYTTNPDVASGDGVAAAYRAGARVANMEFVQFHPTCLYHPDARTFLISEALRGEGGKLRNRRGEAFMRRFDPREELAPRDVVARAIDSELKRSGEDCVFLDMTHMSRESLQDHFPNIYAQCHELGIDIAVAPIPVVPAAHYQCGGVVTDLAGESTIRNLFVLGEAACTGLHGANRLASNSLLEAASYAVHAAAVLAERLPSLSVADGVPEWDSGKAGPPDEQVITSHVWDEVRRLMWNYVGIVRTNRRLVAARKRIELIQQELRDYYWDFQLTGDMVELRNITTVAELVVECALRRRESRGLHFNTDYPEHDPRFLRDTILEMQLW